MEVQFFYSGEQHVQFIRVTGPAFQCSVAVPQSFCPLFALLCLCNFPPWWLPYFSPLSPVVRLLLPGQPFGRTAVDLNCEHTWETYEACQEPTKLKASRLCQRLLLPCTYHSSRCLKFKLKTSFTTPFHISEMIKWNVMGEKWTNWLKHN